MADIQGFFRGLTQYGDVEFSAFLRSVFLSTMGVSRASAGNLVVGIANTSSGYVTCHREMPQLIEAISRGVAKAGGHPVVFPTMSLPEIMVNPTSMYLRNLMAMETEEAIRSQPMDAVVLVGGCDKTVPAQLMAAVSANIPTIQVVAGPMIPGQWRGNRVGACTDCRMIWREYRAGNVTAEDVDEASMQLAPSGGTCGVMGTASTMACLSETLGFAISGSATAAAVSGRRLEIGELSGMAAVEAAKKGIRPRDFLTAESFANAATVLGAIGGSTNAVVHLLAIARRAGIDFNLADIDERTSAVPVLVNCKPAGSGYLTDFDADGGLPQVLHRVADRLALSATTATGESMADRLLATPKKKVDGIGVCEPDQPVNSSGAIRVLRGNLAPSGAVIKTPAATPRLLKHRGPAVVFTSLEDMASRIDLDDLDVTEDSVLVLQHAGPVAAGMPEAGALPIPKKLSRLGVSDMVRISDARMSGTAFGTVVLHVSPEAGVGGPLAAVRDGDIITLDADKGELSVDLDDETIAARLAEYRPYSELPDTSWALIQKKLITQADQGADLDTSRMGA